MNQLFGLQHRKGWYYQYIAFSPPPIWELLIELPFVWKMSI